jgi:hypothetical protein
MTIKLQTNDATEEIKTKEPIDKKKTRSKVALENFLVPNFTKEKNKVAKNDSYEDGTCKFALFLIILLISMLTSIAILVGDLSLEETKTSALRSRLKMLDDSYFELKKSHIELNDTFNELSRDYRFLQYKYDVISELHLKNTIIINKYNNQHNNTTNKYNDRWCLDFVVYDFVVDNFDRIVMTWTAFVNFAILVGAILYNIKNK